MGSARPELLKNKEALADVTEKALILAEASKMEMVPAIDAVAASMNQFNLDSSQSGRIINALGAGALEGSAEIADLTESMKNVGTVASSSNMSLEQTIAAIEVLGEKQLKGAEAGTKLRGALLKLKEAGVGYASGQFNMRDALVEVNAKLEGLGSALEKDALKQKMFGIENITAGDILLQNIDKYEKLTEAVTGTDTATRQAAINTATNNAKLAQAKNELTNLSIELGKRFSPALTSGTSSLSLFIKAIMTTIDFVGRHKIAIITLISTIAAYNTATKLATLWEGWHNKEKLAGIVLSKL
jgi:TP901 family phage tail tape measure protein